MSPIQTAERVSNKDLSDNYVFQRSALAYVETAKLVSGDVLEIGTGSGYGIDIIAPHTKKFVTLDKYKAKHIADDKELEKNNITFIRKNIPPLDTIADKSFDFVISFQVIEHIKNDNEFCNEVYRVLKDNGKFIVTTPNKHMSLTRNPWHVREYTINELEQLLRKHFQSVEKKGIFGNDKIMEYYKNNKSSVEKITRFDIFNLQYQLPRQILQIPYDILNRMNRKKLMKDNTSLVSDISMHDYYIDKASDECFDLFYIAGKNGKD